MNYLILWKSVEQSAEDRWTRVADIDSIEKVEDELASWQGLYREVFDWVDKNEHQYRRQIVRSVAG